MLGSSNYYPQLLRSNSQLCPCHNYNQLLLDKWMYCVQHLSTFAIVFLTSLALERVYIDVLANPKAMKRRLRHGLNMCEVFPAPTDLPEAIAVGERFGVVTQIPPAIPGFFLLPFRTLSGAHCIYNCGLPDLSISKQSHPRPIYNTCQFHVLGAVKFQSHKHWCTHKDRVLGAVSFAIEHAGNTCWREAIRF